jgi:hypothetical protein
MKKLVLNAFAIMGTVLSISAQNAVTFKVDIGANPLGSGGVFIAGELQSEASGGAVDDWTGGSAAFQLTQEGTTTVYAITLDLPADTFKYKFLNGSSGWESDFAPGTCSPNGGNREIIVTTNPQATDVTCFNSCSACPLISNFYSLTINVDMRYNCSFNVDGPDSVDVAGTFNGFSGGPAYLLSDVDNDGVYSITLSDVPEGEVKFKTRIIKNANFGSGWEGGGDKVVQLGSDSILPVRCFGNDVAGACNPIPAPSNVTFRVDMSDQVPAANIFVMGDFTTPAYQGGAIELTSIGSGVYETTVNNICPGKINYKFVNGPVNTPANEESFPDTSDRECVEPNGIGGFNRVFVRPDANPATLAFKFNTCQSTIGFNEPLSNVATMFPNPATESTLIRFASQTETYSLSVMDVLGKRLNQVNSVRGTFTVYRENLKAGIYIVQVSDSKGRTSTQKLIFN